MGQDPNRDEIQSEGRKKNAALPLNVEKENAGAERYPPARKDDSVERVESQARTFGAGGDNPKPRQGAGDGGPPPSKNDGLLGPDGDPAEGKR
ncbi:MAG: hypothetical protein ACOY5Y_04975 [Pseudomonadota bacterium]|jgi:hypothetical protein